MSRASELADKLASNKRWHELTDDECDEAAAELRRLERVNAELVEALSDLESLAERYRPMGYPIPYAQKKARAALTSATKETKE